MWITRATEWKQHLTMERSGNLVMLSSANVEHYHWWLHHWPGIWVCSSRRFVKVYLHTNWENSSHPEGIYGGLVPGVPAYISRPTEAQGPSIKCCSTINTVDTWKTPVWTTQAHVDFFSINIQLALLIQGFHIRGFNKPQIEISISVWLNPLYLPNL